MTLILSGSDGLSDVDGTASTPAIRGTDTNTGIFFPAADTIAFAEGGVEAMRIDSSGNLGIGTTTPAQKLVVSGTGATSIRINDTNTNSWDITNNSFLSFTRGSTEHMRIDSSGNLLVGTTSASAGNTFTKGILTRGVEKPLGVVCDSNGGSAAVGVGRTNSTGNYFEFYYGTALTSFTGGISTNGSTTSFNTSSDYRLKDNIAPMTGALAKVSALKPCTYTWKADGSNGEGFIAHELQAVVPDCVTGEKDAVEIYTDEDGNEQTRIKPQGIDTSFLVATLTAAIQEQQAIITDLKARIETLEAK